MTVHKKKWNSMELVRFCLLKEVCNGYEVQLEGSEEFGFYSTQERHALGTCLSGYVQGETADGKPVLAGQSPGVSQAIEEMEKACRELGVEAQEMVAVMQCAEQLSSLIKAVEEGHEQVKLEDFGSNFDCDLLRVLESAELISQGDRLSLETQLQTSPAISLLERLGERKLLEPRALEILYKARRLYDEQAVPFAMLMVAFTDEMDTGGMMSFEESLLVRGYEVGSQ